MPRSHQFSSGLQQQLGSATVVEVDYIGWRNSNEGNSRNINLTYNPATGLPRTTSNTAFVVYPEYVDVVMSTNDGQSRLHQAVASVRRRFSNCDLFVCARVYLRGSAGESGL